MTNLIPIFPLNIVVFPGEQLNLHIFEPRYKQLITDCFAEAKPFGIPTVLNDTINEFGTLVEIVEVVAVHADGKMDISTKGLRIFNMLETIKILPDKLYSGAIVTYPANDERVKSKMMGEILGDIRRLHALLNLTKDFKKPDTNLVSYDVAHHAGLTVKEEYEVLGLLREDQRLEYLKRHLGKIIAMVAGMENLKEKIQLNGHFRELKGFNL